MIVYCCSLKNKVNINLLSVNEGIRPTWWRADSVCTALLCLKLVILDAKSNTVVQSLPLQRNEQEVDVYDLKPANSYLACLQLHVCSN